MPLAFTTFYGKLPKLDKKLELPSETGRDRAHVRAYATWKVAHQLARTSQRDRPTKASEKYARSLVSEAIKLVCWLHDQQLELADLRQDLLDTWIADGAGTRRGARMFITWLTNDIAMTSNSEKVLTIGPGSFILPEPLASIALDLRTCQLQRIGAEGWLLPGRHAGTPVSADSLRLRLKRYDITSRRGRHSALLALAARLPAPILADRLGIDQARAAQWVRAAGATYAPYIELRTGTQRYSRSR
jgi:hypothetical protein